MPEIRVCPICKKEFIAYDRRWHYCSDKCSAEAMMKRNRENVSKFYKRLRAIYYDTHRKEWKPS